jgi:hypothetical protein
MKSLPDAILELLSKHPEGLTITSIADELGIHRHTATKHVKDLILNGKVNERNVGMAKLCFLSRYKDKHAVNSKAETGQAQMLFLALLMLSIPVLIIAQNFSTTITGDFAADSSLIPSSSDLVETTTSTTVEKSTTQAADTTTTLPENNVENSTVFPLGSEENNSIREPYVNNETFQNSNEIINDAILEQDANTSGNETLATQGISIVDNETLATQEGTQENGLSETPEEKIDLQLNLPEKVNRGEEFSANALATNKFSTHKNVVLKWMLPAGFEITSGEVEKPCSLEAGQSCVSDIKIIAHSELGLHEIKVTAKYE